MLVIVFLHIIYSNLIHSLSISTTFCAFENVYFLMVYGMYTVHTVHTYIQYIHTYVHTYSVYTLTYSAYACTYIQCVDTYIQCVSLVHRTPYRW